MQYDELALQQVRERRLLIDQCDAWLFELVEPFIGQRVLEVGCGLGNLTRHLLNRECVVGIDVDADSVDYVNRTYGHSPNIHAAVCDVTNGALLELKKYQFDTAISLNVLEHIEDDVLALKRISDTLMPDGKLILIVPAHMALYGPMDSSIGHFRRYTQADMAAKLRRAGFEVCSQRYLNPVGALGWLVNGRVLRRQVAPVAQLKLFNKLVPLIASVENRFDAPFGLSLMSVSRRVG